jgi:hypothetical protein
MKSTGNKSQVINRPAIAVCVTLASLAILNLQLSTFAQGSLTPPGAPAPTMKTLQQVEPRTDVLTLAGNANYQYTINAPGAYYLTTNIVGVAGKSGILIDASNVTLDLNGFELLGVLNSFDAIYVGPLAVNASIYNGTMKNWGDSGVNASASACRYEKLLLTGNTSVGLSVSANSAIVDCTATLNGFDGFSAGYHSTFSGCKSAGNNGNGFDTGNECLFVNCTAYANTNHGFYPDLYCTVRDCIADFNKQDGINVNFSSCVVKDCAANNNAGNGITLGTRCVAQNNSCNGNTNVGIYASLDFNRIDSNQLMQNLAYGVQVLANKNNLIVRNSASSPGLASAYNIPAGNTYGPFVALGLGVINGAGNSTGWENFDDYYFMP